MATVAVVQIGSILARLASGTQRSTLALPWAMAGALSALAMAAAEALNNVLRCISVSRIPVDERGPPAFFDGYNPAVVRRAQERPCATCPSTASHGSARWLLQSALR